MKNTQINKSCQYCLKDFKSYTGNNVIPGNSKVNIEIHKEMTLFK